MTHADYLTLGLWIAGLIVLPIFPLLLLVPWYRWPRKFIGWLGITFMLSHLIGMPLSACLFYGTHFDGNGLLLGKDGVSFADGCPIDGLSLALHRSGHAGEINAVIGILIVLMIIVPLAHEVRKAGRKRRALIESARVADEGTDGPDWSRALGGGASWDR